MLWTDARLSWMTGRTQDYSNINYMYATEKQVWTPTIYVENSIVDLSVISDPNTPMRVDKNGRIRWSTSAIYIVSCESEITYYPLDHQTCTIKLATAGYTAANIALRFNIAPVSLYYYTENGEWELLSVENTKPADNFMGGEPYSKVIFSIHMRRRPMFHILNTMFPVVLMAFLIPMAFKLHVDSGEKMGYSLTVLLAYAVYLSMISDNIPSTSVSICFLSIYLATTLVLSTMSVLFVIIVINVHHTPEDEPMSPRVQNIAYKLECCLCRGRRDTSTNKIIKVAPSPDDSIDKPTILNDREEDEEKMSWVRLSRLYTLIGGGGGKPPPPSYSPALESQLRTEIFTGYSVLQRPTKQVLVRVELTLLTVNDLVWYDPRLSWVSSRNLSQDYTNIIFMFSNENYVWKPCVFIENSIDDLSVISDPNTPMRLNIIGFVRWSPSGIFKVNCESDITYYPLDYQTCDIKLTTSSYTLWEIRLGMADEPVNLNFYAENGEWELLSALGMASNDKTRGGQSFSSLNYRISMRRRPLFHVLNTMFPVALMAFLIPLTFKLHVDSGEKIGYSLTVLLAYAVYLSVISENIPSTSVSVCYMSIYLAAVLGAGTIAVLFVIIVINVYHNPDTKPVPTWTRRFTILLMKLFCMYPTCRPCKSNKTRPVEKTPVTELVKMPVISNDDVIEEEEEEEKTELTWKMVSEVLDHFFFIVFMLVVLVSTITFVAVIVMKYITY
ncbi:neuronal acetylcholine receptor subunit alpha-3-like [Saccostrea cucullata]|uniref:neuronal acetylcholine receptor subunit alpha-3-like n=1 Tax=Saccostrea cuccullata TaxID=36930 RepID=UPI002ED58001